MFNKHLIMLRILIVLLLCNGSIKAQTLSEKSAVKKVIETFFEALHKGDSMLIKKTMHSEIKIQTTLNNKKGKQRLKTETKKQFLHYLQS